MKKHFLKVIAVFCAPLFIACEKNDDPPENTGYTKGIFIVNEGAYNANNGSISYVDPENTLIINDIFNAANSRPLGDIVQSFTVVNDSLGFIVVNHSAKMEMVRMSSFQAVREPLAFAYPRYFLQVTADKGYLTAGNFAGNVHIIDLLTLTATDSIGVGLGPEVLIKTGDRVYVANSGGWGSDSTLSVINIDSDLVVDTVFVGKVPVDMALDAQGFIWVYCKGYTDYADIATDSYIQKVDLSENQVVWQHKVGNALDYMSVPAKCALSDDGSVLYYLRPDGVYSLDTDNPVMADSPLISGSFYGLDVNPSNGRIYVFESSFTANGTMKIYEPDGTLFAQGTVGIGPSAAIFNLQ